MRPMLLTDDGQRFSEAFGSFLAVQVSRWLAAAPTVKRSATSWSHGDLRAGAVLFPYQRHWQLECTMPKLSARACHHTLGFRYAA